MNKVHYYTSSQSQGDLIKLIIYTTHDQVLYIIYNEL